LATLFAAQLFDFGTFSVMVGRHGVIAELNPVVAAGFVFFGLPFLALAKLVLVVLVGSIVVLLGRREGRDRLTVPSLAAGLCVLAVTGGLLGGISNVIAT
jgi:hypothetical protein